MTAEPSIQNGKEFPPRLRDRVMKAGGWVTAGFVLDKIIAALQLFILVRLLTPADFGLMAASAVVLLALMTLSEFGLEPALVSRREVTETDLAVAWTIAVLRGALLAGLLWSLAGPVAAFFRTPELAGFLRVHGLALLLQGVQSPALALLLRDLHLRQRVQLDLTRRLVEAFVTLLLAVWLRSAWALLIGQLAGFAVGSLLSYRVAPFRPRFSLDRSSLRHFIGFGKHLNATTIFIFGVMSGGDFVVGRLLGTEGLGLYQVAMAIPLLIGVRATVMLNQVSLPTYALLRDDQAKTIKAFSLQVGLVGLLLVPIAAGLAVLAPGLVPVLFGQTWIAITDPLRVLCLYAMCSGFSGVMASLHYGVGRPEVQTRIWCAQFGIYAVMIVPLTARFGVMGAAGALAVSFVLGLLLNVRATLKVLGPEAREAFAPLGRIGLLVGLLAGLLLLVPWFHTEAIPIWLLAAYGLLGLCLYAIYLWWVEYPKLRDLWARQ